MLKFTRDGIIRTSRGEGAMPRPAVRVGLGVGDLRDRSMRPTPLMRGQRRVPGGADKWVPELNRTRAPNWQSPASPAGAPASALMPCRSAARHTIAGWPRGSAAAMSTRRRRSLVTPLAPAARRTRAPARVLTGAAPSLRRQGCELSTTGTP